MNNPTEDEKKALANERRRERRRCDPAYRERERQWKQDPAYRERELERQRQRYRTDSTYRERMKEGSRERQRERRRAGLAKHTPGALERRRDRKYGLEPGQWDAEFDRLRGICPIDGVAMIRKAPSNGRMPDNLAVTDHDHETNKFRGIICNHCNKNLTKTWCKPQVLRNALAYLKRTGRDVDAPTQGTLL